MQRHRVAAILAGALMHVASATASAADAAAGVPHARINNVRIADAFNLAREHSEAFRAIVEALGASDTYVLIDAAVCPGSLVRSCVHLLAPSIPRVRAVLVRIDARQPTLVIVAQLAHELRHATEIASHPEVVDGPTLQEMYRSIGYQSCDTYQTVCWETRDARATERLVVEQVKRFKTLMAIKP